MRPKQGLNVIKMHGVYWEWKTDDLSEVGTIKGEVLGRLHLNIYRLAEETKHGRKK